MQAPAQLAAHLKSLRKARGLTQAQLGALVGVGRSRIGEIEGDPGSVSLEQLLQLLHTLRARLVLRVDTGSEGEERGARQAPSSNRW